MWLQDSASLLVWNRPSAQAATRKPVLGLFAAEPRESQTLQMKPPCCLLTPTWPPGTPSPLPAPPAHKSPPSEMLSYEVKGWKFS